MEGMSSTSQKAAAHIISVYCGAPRVSLRLQRLLSPKNPQCTLLPSSCTPLQQTPDRGSLLPYSRPQAWGASPPTRESNPPPCLISLLSSVHSVVKHWKAGEGPQQQQWLVKWPSFHLRYYPHNPIVVIVLWTQLGWTAQESRLREVCLTKGIRHVLNAHLQRKVRLYRNTAPGRSCKSLILTPANIKKIPH